MNKLFSAPKFILKLSVLTISLLSLIMTVVAIFDPFYHYHKPLPFLKAVLWEKEYQVPGTLDHFDYNAMIVGSSVAENNNNHWFDDTFNCQSIKAIRSSGPTADLCYFINRGFEHQDLKYVFLNLDPSSLTSKPQITFVETGAPLYLYDQNPLNDVKYLLNKDVLLERIPYMVASSLMKNYDEGASYNWSQWKEFSQEATLSHYYQQPQIKDMLPKEHYEEIALENIALIEDIVRTHPETEFYIFVPPYSILWWDSIQRSGETESYIYAQGLFFEHLLPYENVRLYNFQNDHATIFNLNNYMDNIHFSSEINYHICQCLKEGQYEIKDASQIESSLNDVRSYALDMVSYVTETYGDEIRVDILQSEVDD